MNDDLQKFNRLLQEQVGSPPGKAILSFSQELDNRLTEMRSKWAAIQAKEVSGERFYFVVEDAYPTLDSIENYLDATHRYSYDKEDAELQFVAMMCTELKVHVRGAKEYSKLLLKTRGQESQATQELIHLLHKFLGNIEQAVQMLSVCLSALTPR